MTQEEGRQVERLELPSVKGDNDQRITMMRTIMAMMLMMLASLRWTTPMMNDDEQQYYVLPQCFVFLDLEQCHFLMKKIMGRNFYCASLVVDCVFLFCF